MAVLTLDALFGNLLYASLAAIFFLISFNLFFRNTKVGNLSLPPSFSYLVPTLTGKFEMKKHGPIKLITAGYKQCGEIFRIRVLHRHVTFLIGPEPSALVFASSDSEVSARNVYGFMIPVFGKGIVYDATNEVMAQQLKWIFFGLGKKFFETYCEKIYLEAARYFERVGEETERDVHSDMLELVSFTASRCLLGDEIRENMTEDVGHWLKDLSDGISHMSLLMPTLPTKAHKLRDEARDKIYAIVLDIIAKRRKENIEVHDYLQHIMNSSYRDGSKPTDANVAGLILSTLFGGQHTSSNILSWLVMIIAQNKSEFFDRLMEEQKEAFKLPGGFSIEKLDQMPLLHNSLKEILRMYPPLIVLAREALKPLRYKDFYVPKNDIIAVSPSVTHRLPQIYKNPDKFDPDRFDEPRNEGSGRYEHQPFGGGKHICLGRHFAFIQMKIIFSVFFQLFEFELVDPDWKAEVDYSHIIAGPPEHNFVRLKRRPKSEVLFLNCK